MHFPHVCLFSQWIFFMLPKSPSTSWIPGQMVGLLALHTKEPNQDGLINTALLTGLRSSSPVTSSPEGKEVMIMDNLSSHFCTKVLELAQLHYILYVFLLPNGTGLLQPLDVGVFGPIKKAWYQVLMTWKKGQGCRFTTLPKQHFPSLLPNLLDPQLEKCLT